MVPCGTTLSNLLGARGNNCEHYARIGRVLSYLIPSPPHAAHNLSSFRLFSKLQLPCYTPSQDSQGISTRREMACPVRNRLSSPEMACLVEKQTIRSRNSLSSREIACPVQKWPVNLRNSLSSREIACTDQKQLVLVEKQPVRIRNSLYRSEIACPDQKQLVLVEEQPVLDQKQPVPDLKQPLYSRNNLSSPEIACPRSEIASLVKKQPVQSSLEEIQVENNDQPNLSN